MVEKYVVLSSKLSLLKIQMNNMLKQIVTNYKKKSLKQRFLLFIGVLFLMIYLTLGVVLIFWAKFPIRMETNYRIALGVLLIVYGFFRFWRLLKTDSDD